MSKTGSDLWKELLRDALRCLDSLGALGLAVPEWTFGGGTVLMLRYGHRLSRDVDIFLHDAQPLTALSPRLNEAVAALAGSYVEASSSLRLSVGQGEIDFIVAPSLLHDPPLPMEFESRRVLTDTSAEIVAKKLFYRTAGLKVRDVFDLAVVLEHEPGTPARLREVLAGRGAQLARRMRFLERDFDQRLAREVALLDAGRAAAPGAYATARTFVEGLETKR